MSIPVNLHSIIASFYRSSSCVGRTFKMVAEIISRIICTIWVICNTAKITVYIRTFNLIFKKLKLSAHIGIVKIVLGAILFQSS